MKRHLIISFLVATCFTVIICNAQDGTMRPGDVDNNGIVTHLDIFYWSLARAQDRTGPPRSDQDDTFEGPPVVINEFWGGEPIETTSLDLAYADGNGDGVIDGQDSIIIVNNYGFQVVTDGDFFPQPDELFDPYIILDPIEDEIVEGSTFDIDVFLEKAIIPNNSFAEDKFWAVAFSISYSIRPDADQGKPVFIDYSLIDDEGDDVFLGKRGVDTDVFFLDRRLLNNGSGYNGNSRDTSTVDVIIYRRKEQLEGEDLDKTLIGRFIVISEELVFLKNTTMDVGPGKLMNTEGKIRPISRGPNNEGFIEFRLLASSTINDTKSNYFKSYPVPIQETLYINMVDGQEVIEKVEIHDIHGVRRMEQKIGSVSGQLNLNNLNPGTYVVKVFSDDKIYIRIVTKMP